MQQRIIYWSLATAIGLTRLYALSRSLWDWDEALFCAGVRSFDVAEHHPHPPGFPLFIVAGKFVHLFVHNEFRAVQAVTLIGAILLFPALFMLARELRFPFFVAAGGAALYTFFPNVWLFGGTAFSDIPSTTLVLFACAFLLRGCRDRRAYLLGALLLGISVGFRTQNLLFGCAPSLYATWCRIRERDWRLVAGAIGLGAGIVIVSYTGAAYTTPNPPHGYLTAVGQLQNYVRTVDSFLNPKRMPLLTLAADIFVRPMRSGKFDFIVFAFVVLGLIATVRRFGTIMALLIFLPFQIFAWLMLDPFSIGRYATAYLPLYALLAAAGAHVIRWFYADAILVAAMIGRLGTWTVPPLRVVRSGESPPVAAMRTILRERPPRVFVRGDLAAQRDYLLPQYPKYEYVFDNDADVPMNIAFANDPYLAEDIKMADRTRKFYRRHDRLWNIVRHRYFEVSITPMGELWRFRDGWYDDEGEPPDMFRWMGRRSVTLLPPVGSRARLTLSFGIPQEVVPLGTTLTITLNGSVAGRMRCTSGINTQSWDVAARTDGPNELVLSLDHWVNPLQQHLGSDPRDLGLQLKSYGWTAIP